MTADAPDLPLVERCQSGDVEAFAVLAARYRDRIYSFLKHSVHDGATAEDLAQDVFVKAFAGIRRFNRRASFATWLYRIAHNRVVDYKRREKRRRPIQAFSLDAHSGDEGSGVEIPDDRMEPGRALECMEMDAVVRQTVAGLSDKLRTVLLLFDVEGLAYQEIAEVVGCPVGTVKSRLFLARAELKAGLSAYLQPELHIRPVEGGGKR